MDLFLSLPISPGGVLVAAACVVAGAPLFARGLRARRLRRCLADLAERPLTADVSGLVRVRGRVALEGPLFAPVSGSACAGFQLEVRGEGASVGGVVRDWRAFRLESGETSAIVPAEHADWHAPVTAECTLAVGATIPERLARLLDSCAELRWLRERGVALQVVERALAAGRTVSVMGVVRSERISVAAETEELAATGTDGGGFSAPRLLPGPPVETFELQFEADDTLERVLVFADPPDEALARPSRWNETLALLGPALSIAGLVYLARAAEPLLSRRS